MRLALFVILGLSIAFGIYVSMARDDTLAPQARTLNFGNWRVDCVVNEEGAQSCEMSQRLIDRKSGQQILRLAFRLHPSTQALGLVAVAPLGVTLESGAVVRFSEQDMHQLAYSRCLPGGCLIETEVEEDLLDSMRTAPEGQFIVVDRANQPAPLPFFTASFDEAYRALIKEQRSDQDLQTLVKGLWARAMSFLRSELDE